MIEIEYKEYTIRQLQTLCLYRGIEYKTYWRKRDYISALEEQEEIKQEAPPRSVRVQRIYDQNEKG